MINIFKNSLVFLLAILAGMGVNMSLIVIGGYLIPLQEGMDPMNAEFWEIKNFIFPFLAHALGTLAGAFVAAKYTTKYPMVFALFIGVFFLIGGTYMVFLLPAPIWFICTDLILAYIPMGWLGARLARI